MAPPSARVPAAGTRERKGWVNACLGGDRTLAAMDRPGGDGPSRAAAACDLVLPCRDEGPALTSLLPRIPPLFAVIVVDNGSTDDTAEVARRLGADVVLEPTPGYGAAVHAGLEAASRDYVAFMDGDGSFDPGELLPLLDDVRAGRADLAVGRRRPVSRGVWPWHARVGNQLIVRWLRGRIGMEAHDIAPMRVCRRQALLDLGVADRRFGYPLELLHKATLAGLAPRRARRGLPPAGGGHPLEGLRLGEGHRAHGAGLLEGPRVSASAPGAARSSWRRRRCRASRKTRLAAEVGDDAAARLAAACLLDTLDACEAAFGPERVLVALTGDLDAAVDGDALRARLAAYPEGAVFEQCEGGFDARLAHAHATAGERAPGAAVVQVGMDTPQLTGALLGAVATDLDGADAVLGAAADGGWWVLALRDPAAARALEGVPMSTDRTGADTRAALEAAGLRVASAPVLRDVDEVPDAAEVAEAAPRTRFARGWRDCRPQAARGASGARSAR